jgi:hypothetical protein
MHSRANSVQHGGTHYQAALQHWDWVAINGLDYFAAAATKYVTRWRKKDGKIALEKAGHFVVKAAELHRAGLLRGRGMACVPINEYAAANDLNETEAAICHLLCTWRTVENLHRAHSLITQLWESAPASAPAPTPATLDIAALVYPTGWIGFTYEGSVKDENLFRCKHCRAMLRIPVDTAPALHHACGEATREYVHQDR